MAFPLRRIYRDNGAFLTLCAVFGAAGRLIFSELLSLAVKGRPELRVHPSAHIRGLAHMTIGNNFRAGRNLWLEAVTQDGDRFYSPRIEIGKNVIVNDFVHIGATNFISIGDNVLLASHIFISDHHHGNYRGRNGSDPDIPPQLRQITRGSQVVIEDNVWIGDMTSVFAGVTIGRGSVIGGHSVVTRSVPPNCIAVGNPARVIKQYCPIEKIWKPVTGTAELEHSGDRSG
jgi:lipopolysaccharide O-acetyltransferase